MPIRTDPPQPARLMYERTVGAVTADCIMPSILDCIGVVGWAPSKMVCTHLTPGLDATEFDQTFDALKEIGGNWASPWYIVGALQRHFNTSRFLKSRADIKSTFNDKFGNARIYVLDATTEQSTLPMQAMDLRFERNGTDGTFSYCRFGGVPANAAAYAGKAWTPFPDNKLTIL